MSGTPAGTVVVRAADLRFRGDGTIVVGDCAPQSGEFAVFCRPVVTAPAVIRRDGPVLRQTGRISGKISSQGAEFMTYTLKTAVAIECRVLDR